MLESVGKTQKHTRVTFSMEFNLDFKQPSFNIELTEENLLEREKI